MAKEKEVITKKRKKIWVDMLAPVYLGGSSLGETRVYQTSDALKKSMVLSLATLTGDIKKQNMKLVFTGVSVEGNNVRTTVSAVTLMPAAIKRLVRRERDRVDDSFVCLTADNQRVRIKPLVITSNATVQSLRTKLRKAMRTVLRKRIRALTYEQLINEVIGFKLHSAVRESVRKVYPLKAFEIKFIGLEHRKANKSEKQEIERSLAEKEVKPEEEEEPKDEDQESPENEAESEQSEDDDSSDEEVQG
ncbi:hypothetical protein HZB01_04465 [Candidatus Woesearchaeota archaeon]|nr:hypothetical protein [Candidatus Woesearchaeota archaeon]